MERFDDKDLKILLSVKEKTIGSCKNEKCDNGWIEGLKPCECRKAFVFLKELVFSRIPYEYWNRRISDMDIKPKTSSIIIEKYLNYLKRGEIFSGKGVCLLGPNGVGKTTILSDIGKEGVLRGSRVVYITAQNYIDAKMLNNYSELELVEKNSDIILLDEIDKPYKKKGSDYVISQVENLFREILPKNKILCLGSNWTEAEINEYFGDSVYSIMCGKIKFITIVGDDMRTELQNKWMEDLEEKSLDLLSENVFYFSKRMRVNYE